MKPISLSIKYLFNLAAFMAVIALIFAGCQGNGHKADNDSIFTTVEKSADFPGGIDQFYYYLSHNINYPQMARENNITGKVIITFVVEKNGSLTNIKVLRGIGSGCDDEAVRVLRASPKWIPGTQMGRPVRQQYTVPISFTLQD